MTEFYYDAGQCFRCKDDLRLEEREGQFVAVCRRCDLIVGIVESKDPAPAPVTLPQNLAEVEGGDSTP